MIEVKPVPILLRRHLRGPPFAAVDAQAGAYATGVLVLITSVALAATIATPARRHAFAIVLAVFLYAGLVAIVVQTVVIPRWAPAWHAGHGLLQGVDAVTYHDLAEQRAHAIRADGWAVWRLRPRGHVPAGIA